MTALEQYERLEASGLWRSTPDAQRRDVILSLGETTLLITDMQDRVLAHWSLPAVARLNPGAFPACYYPLGNPGETLELDADQTEMIDAIARLQKTLNRQRPRPGRLRGWAIWGGVLGVIAFVLLAVPQLTRSKALNVIPEVTLQEIGQTLLTQIQKTTGSACDENDGPAALRALAERLAPDGAPPQRYIVVKDGIDSVLSLPGDTVIIHQRLVAEADDAELLAGYLIATQVADAAEPPASRLLESVGTVATLRLMGTGHLTESALQNYARRLLSEPMPAQPVAELAPQFQSLHVRMAPYLAARGLTESPETYPTEPLLTDGDWLRLQSICGI